MFITSLWVIVYDIFFKGKIFWSDLRSVSLHQAKSDCCFVQRNSYKVMACSTSRQTVMNTYKVACCTTYLWILKSNRRHVFLGDWWQFLFGLWMFCLSVRGNMKTYEDTQTVINFCKIVKEKKISKNVIRIIAHVVCERRHHLKIVWNWINLSSCISIEN